MPKRIHSKRSRCTAKKSIKMRRHWNISRTFLAMGTNASPAAASATKSTKPAPKHAPRAGRRRLRSASRNAMSASEAKQASIAKFEQDHPDIIKWWSDNNFSFACSLRDSLYRWGRLSDNQIAAAKRAIEAWLSTAKSKRRKSRLFRPWTLPASKRLSIRPKIPASKARSCAWPAKAKTRCLVIKEASVNSRNYGSLYVIGDVSLGKITGGKFIKSRDCTDTENEEILKMFERPMESAVAYGRKSWSMLILRSRADQPRIHRNGNRPYLRRKVLRMIHLTIKVTAWFALPWATGWPS
ncbi:hypothetical protein WP1_109 [Pseudomonas phage WP1]